MEKINTGQILQYIYSEKYFEKKFLRCSIEVSEEGVLIDEDVKLRYVFLANIYGYLSKIAVPRYKYFGFYGQVAAGISKTMIPLHLSKYGAYVDIPEYKFKQEDTGKMPTPRHIRVRDLWEV